MSGIGQMINEKERSFKKPERLSLKLQSDQDKLATVSSGHPDVFDAHDQTSFKNTIHDKSNAFEEKVLPGYERTHSILDRVQLEMLSSIHNNQVIDGVDSSNDLEAL
jgi:hypothetical protein